MSASLRDVIINAVEEVSTTPGTDFFDLDDVYGFILSTDHRLRRAIPALSKVHPKFNLSTWVESYLRQRIATTLAQTADEQGVRIWINAEAQGKRGVYVINVRANAEFHRKVANTARLRALSHLQEADFRDAVAERMEADGALALEDYGDDYASVIEEVREEKQGAITAAVVKLLD